jgi:hypothetical protein
MFKQPAPKKNKSKAKAQSIGLYRKVVISFMVITSILILIVLYFSFVSAKITVVPRPEKVTADFTVTVVEAQDGLVADQINGVFFSKKVEGEKQFSATGSKSVSTDIVGKVTITNNYRRPQPLVATTRLLSADNILLRIKERVDVPVGGSVDVAVYADNPEQLKDRILPVGTKFTIPGLWPQLQDKIYAKAKEPIKLGENKVTVLTDDDVKNAKANLLDQLEMQIFVELGLDGNVAKAIDIKEGEAVTSAKVGDAVETFKLKLKATVSGVLFDKENMIKLAENRLRGNLAQDKQIANVDYNSLTYTVEKIDLQNKNATVQIHLEGTAVLRLNSKIFDKDKLKGLSRQQVNSYFFQEPLVDSVTVDFFPFWVRHVPQLPDHIEVIVK